MRTRAAAGHLQRRQRLVVPAAGVVMAVPLLMCLQPRWRLAPGRHPAAVAEQTLAVPGMAEQPVAQCPQRLQLARVEPRMGTAAVPARRLPPAAAGSLVAPLAAHLVLQTVAAVEVQTQASAARPLLLLLAGPPAAGDAQPQEVVA